MSRDVIGAVGPFGLRLPVRVLIDTGLLAQDELSIGSGVRGTAVILRSEALMLGTPGRRGDLSAGGLTLLLQGAWCWLGHS